MDVSGSFARLRNADADRLWLSDFDRVIAENWYRLTGPEKAYFGAATLRSGLHLDFGAWVSISLFADFRTASSVPVLSSLDRELALLFSPPSGTVISDALFFLAEIASSAQKDHVSTGLIDLAEKMAANR